MPRRGFGLFIALRLQNADVGEIAVVICVIEAVADDELVRDLEAAHIGLVALGMARRLVQERDRRNGCGVPCAEELAQVAVFQEFLPKQLTAEELAAEVKAVIAEVGATSMKEMGKVMGVASKRLAGRADGKDISAKVKELLA